MPPDQVPFFLLFDKQRRRWRHVGWYLPGKSSLEGLRIQLRYVLVTLTTYYFAYLAEA